ncbi:GDP-mannose 4,6-dehydratase [Bacillus haimaensis]|uniref:GDP-mannose 4,6-dehydratase n=1 Tax=Bacillus haimaensis TaxID=3160967 RepID=UPI003AA91AA0
MNVIVTGGCGFIGSHLVDLLITEGYDKYVIDNMTAGNAQFLNKKAKYFYLNILDFRKLKSIFEEVKPKAVFHMAAQIDVQASIQNPVFDAQVNILGSINLIELCKAYKSKLIYSSSAAVYGKPLYLPISEHHPIQPISNYGISKYVPEQYIRSYAQLYDVNYTILRYSNVYGPRQVPKREGGVISIIIEKMKTDESPIIFGDGKQTRDFIFVEDVVSANLSALQAKRNGTYNISTGTQISINELTIKLNSILNKDFVPVYKHARPGDIYHSCLDHRLAKTELGWQPIYSILEGMKKTCLQI